VIENYNRIMTEDMGRMLKNGAVSSHFDFINTLTDTDQIGKEKTKYTDKSVLTELESLGLFKKDQKKPIYDADFMLGGKSLEEHVPSVMSQIITSNTFEDGYQNIHEELTRPLHLQKTKSHLLRHYLLKSPLNVVVPGFNFLRRNGERDITIGRQIRLEFLKNDQDLYDKGAFASGSEIIDKKKSGTYVIYALKHVMTMNNYPKQFENEYYGDNIRWFIGIAESGSDEDPMGLRRVRVRVFGLHSPDKEDIDTSDLPWAQVMISGTEDAIPQYGMPPSIKAGAMVFGIFLDGKASQVPLVLGSLPRLRMPNLIPGQSAVPGSNTGEPSTQGGTENAAAAPYTGQKVTPPAYLQNDPAWQAKSQIGRDEKGISGV